MLLLRLLHLRVNFGIAFRDDLATFPYGATAVATPTTGSLCSGGCSARLCVYDSVMCWCFILESCPVLWPCVDIHVVAVQLLLLCHVLGGVWWLPVQIRVYVMPATAATHQLQQHQP